MRVIISLRIWNFGEKLAVCGVALQSLKGGAQPLVTGVLFKLLQLPRKETSQRPWLFSTARQEHET
jgi:hypothetical protein